MYTELVYGKYSRNGRNVKNKLILTIVYNSIINRIYKSVNSFITLNCS